MEVTIHNPQGKWFMRPLSGGTIYLNFTEKSEDFVPGNEISLFFRDKDPKKLQALVDLLNELTGESDERPDADGEGQGADGGTRADEPSDIDEQQDDGGAADTEKKARRDEGEIPF